VAMFWKIVPIQPPSILRIPLDCVTSILRVGAIRAQIHALRVCCTTDTVV
jgi:hypothetical protein